MNMPRFPTLAAVISVVSVVYLIISSFVVDTTRDFFHEGHGFEELSLGLLVGALGLWFWLAGRHRWREWQVPALLVLMLARELDMDKRLTDHGLLKLTTYTREAPMGNKIIGGIVIAFTLWAAGRLLRRNLPTWWRRLRMNTADAWLILLAGLSGVLAKTLDGLGRKLADFGIYIPEWINTLAGQSEEVLEAACYYFIVLAIARLVVPQVRHAAGLSPATAG